MSRKGQVGILFTAIVTAIITYVLIGALGAAIGESVSSWGGGLKVLGFAIKLVLPGPEDAWVEVVKILWGIAAGTGAFIGGSS